LQLIQDNITYLSMNASFHDSPQLKFNKVTILEVTECFSTDLLSLDNFPVI